MLTLHHHLLFLTNSDIRAIVPFVVPTSYLPLRRPSNQPRPLPRIHSCHPSHEQRLAKPSGLVFGRVVGTGTLMDLRFQPNHPPVPSLMSQNDEIIKILQSQRIAKKGDKYNAFKIIFRQKEALSAYLNALSLGSSKEEFSHLLIM